MSAPPFNPPLESAELLRSIGGIYTAASKVLSNPRSTPAEKTAAGSALSQRPDRKGGGRKK